MKWIIALLSIAMLSGCAWMDLDGNGRVDLLAYLSVVDVTVQWVDAAGETYTVALDELGARLAGTFVQAKTGYFFELTDGGGITVTDPAGVKVTIKRKEQ